MIRQMKWDKAVSSYILILLSRKVWLCLFCSLFYFSCFLICANLCGFLIVLPILVLINRKLTDQSNHPQGIPSFPISSYLFNKVNKRNLNIQDLKHFISVRLPCLLLYCTNQSNLIDSAMQQNHESKITISCDTFIKRKMTPFAIRKWIFCIHPYFSIEQ